MCMCFLFQKKKKKTDSGSVRTNNQATTGTEIIPFLLGRWGQVRLACR